MQTAQENLRVETGRILDPFERFSEILFGLIMVLTFTGSLSVATSSQEDVRAMCVGAVGCNLAWGLVDGVMYLSAILVERGRMLALTRAVRATADRTAARSLVANAMPDGFESVVEPAELDAIAERVRALPEPARHPGLVSRDFAGALAVLLLVFVSTLPVVVPFLFIHDPRRAMRWSNGIAIVLLFYVGYRKASWGGLPRIPYALAMVGIGLVLVALTIALGG